MNRIAKTLLVAICIAFLPLIPSAAADPVGDFFKRLGNSIAHPGAPKPRPKTQKRVKTAKKNSDATASQTPTAPQAEGETAPPVNQTREVATPEPSESVATPMPLPIRVATNAPESRGRRRDIPYGIPVPNRTGFVTSPYAPNQGLVDVRAFPSGTEVKDPFTGKTFLTP